MQTSKLRWLVVAYFVIALTMRFVPHAYNVAGFGALALFAGCYLNAWQGMVIAFGAGWVSHIVIDILTHGDPRFQAFGDPHYIWPVGNLRGLGIWEYRIKVGQLWPVKAGEAATILLCCELTFYFWFTHR